MKILDATCGLKSIWYQKNHPFVTFMDIRNGTIINTPNAKIKNRRKWKIEPDVISDWSNTPFKDNEFDMVIFDPPHNIKPESYSYSNLELQYGRLNEHDYKTILSEGINELFRVLKSEGIFILKWCEKDKPVKDVLTLFPYPPLFGTRTGQKNNNHWIVFLKYDVNKKLDFKEN